MTYTPPDEQLIWDIVKAAKAAMRYAEGASRQTLDDDDMRASAIIRQLGIVGEAVSKLSQEFRASHAECSLARCHCHAEHFDPRLSSR